MKADIAPDADQLAHLEEERDFLLRSVRDLERERDAGDIDEDDYRALKDDYTARAAAAIRAVDEARGVPRAASRLAKPRTAPDAGVSRKRLRWVALVVIGVVVLAAVAGVFVASSSGERVEQGGNELARAQEQFRQGQVLDALKLYDRVLRREPDNLEALTYRGWLLFQVSQRAGPSQPQLIDQALASLERAVRIDPRYPDARFFRGFVFLRGKDDPAAAVPELRAFLATNPPAEVRPQVEAVLDEALCRTGQPSASGNPCP